jgi:outer membrane protein TolC
MNCVPSIVLLTVLAAAPLRAQVRVVTLPDAIRLAERTQPSMVQAQAGVRTAAAQRRNAWGAFLPSLTAGSSASEFFSEGAARVDPITGQLTTGTIPTGA